MSGPKDSTYDIDAERIQEQAEALRRAEETRFNELSGVPRDQLGEADWELVQRFEAEQKALSALSAARRTLVRQQIEALHRKWQQAHNSRAAMMAAETSFSPPPLPPRISDVIVQGDDAEAMASAAEQLRQAMQSYEHAYADSCAAMADGIIARGMNEQAQRASGALCYATELFAEAERTEARQAADRVAAFRRQRLEADALLQQAQERDPALISAQALDHYRALLEENDFGARSNRLETLRRQLRTDADLYKEQQERAASIAAEQAAIHRKRVLLEACRAMGWQVVDARDPQSNAIYVAQSGFTNHVRRMRLEMEADGKAHLHMQTLPVEGAQGRATPEQLAQQEREFELKLCGKGGEMEAFQSALGERAFSFVSTKREKPPAAAAVPLDHVPAGLRTRVEADEAKGGGTKAPLKAMPIPRKD